MKLDKNKTKYKYKLFINNVQIGSYTNLKDIMKSALIYVSDKHMYDYIFEKNSCYITTEVK